MKQIYIIHTSLVSYEELTMLFAEIFPEAKVFNIIDDSLLHDVSLNGKVNEKIIGRMCKYFDAAAQNGADLIINQCSSVGEAADIAAKTVGIPVLKIDEAMAEKAVELGTKIGVIATVKSTMAPSCNLIKSKAQKVHKDVYITEYLVNGALDVLMKEKNRKKHNEMVIKAIKTAEKQCDVVVLAQGSMTVLLPELIDAKKIILTSPRLCVEKARKMLMGD